jgi:hypothetical protein
MVVEVVGVVQFYQGHQYWQHQPQVARVVCIIILKMGRRELQGIVQHQEVRVQVGLGTDVVEVVEVREVPRYQILQVLPAEMGALPVVEVEVEVQQPQREMEEMVVPVVEEK